MQDALRLVLIKHGVQNYEVTAHPTKDFSWTVKTAPAPTAEMIEDFKNALSTVQEISFQEMVLPEAPYTHIGVATEPISAGQRVEYCAQRGLIRVER